MRTKAIDDDIKRKIIKEYHSTKITRLELSNKYEYGVSTINKILSNGITQTPKRQIGGGTTQNRLIQNGSSPDVEVIDLEQMTEYKQLKSFIKQNGLE